MKIGEFKDLLGEMRGGKTLPNALYVHVELLPFIPESLRLMVEKLFSRLGLDSSFNVIKFHRKELKISFLAYPDFFGDPHPALVEAVIVNIASGKIRRDDFSSRQNRPILHRKETFLPESHSRFEEFRLLTRQEEKAGLYEDTRTIGFELNWKKLLEKKGLRYRGHQLIKGGKKL